MTTRPSGRSVLSQRILQPRADAPRDEPIQDINQLEDTIRNLGFSLPGAHDEVAEFEKLRDKVDELFTKNRELLGVRCQARAKKVEGAMGNLLQVKGLKELAEKLEVSSRVLKTAEANISSLKRHRHEGESIPVEVDYQQDFLRLIQTAANDRNRIMECLKCVDWILKTRESPEIWRQHLDAHLEAGMSLEAAWNEHTHLSDLIGKLAGKSHPQNNSD